MRELYDIIKTGLEEAIAYERGEIQLEKHIVSKSEKETATQEQEQG